MSICWGRLLLRLEYWVLQEQFNRKLISNNNLTEDVR